MILIRPGLCDRGRGEHLFHSVSACIIYGALCMGRRGAIMIAFERHLLRRSSGPGIFVTSIPPREIPIPLPVRGYVFSRLFIHIVSLHTALLASYLVEREGRQSSPHRTGGFFKSSICSTKASSNPSTCGTSRGPERDGQILNRAAEE